MEREFVCGLINIPSEEGWINIINKFLEKKTFEDRFEVVWSFLPGSALSKRNTNNFMKDKSVVDSIHWRTIGNNGYTATSKNKDYLSKSIEAYNKSIAYAPVGSTELSLAYANRSAVLFKAGLYNDCLLDIERSLKIGYPDNLKTKLHIRQSLCFKALKPSSHIETGISMASAMQWLPNLKKNNPNYNIKNEYSKMMNQLEKPRDTNTAKFTPMIKNKNAIIAGGSDAIELRKTNGNNHYIVATRDIKSGEFIYINKPFEMITSVGKCYTTCWHCYRQTWSSVACDKCSCIIFCSQKCKDIAWNEYHDLECLILSLFLKLDLMDDEDKPLYHLTIKILSKALKATGGIAELKKKINDIDSMKDTSMIYTDNIFDVNTLDNFYRLDYYKPTSDECSFERAIDISAIVETFSEMTNIFARKLRPVDSVILGGLIFRHLMIVERNVMRYTDDVSKNLSLTFAAIMPIREMFVKNCDPHVNWCNCEPNDTFLAQRPIKKGEKISISLVGRYQKDTLSERQMRLEALDLKPCKCSTCAQNLPLLENLPSYKSLKLSKQVQQELDCIVLELGDYFGLIVKENTEKLLKRKDTLAEITDKFYQHVTVPCQEASFFSLMLEKLYQQLADQHRII